MRSFFGRERRRRERLQRTASVVFVVRDGRNPKRVSSPVEATARDFSPLGMSIITAKIAPDGLHVMYDTLMTTRNRIEVKVFPEGRPPIEVAGKVVWFREYSPESAYIFGMQFDEPSPAFKEWLFIE
jgi:hypothetical protein